MKRRYASETDYEGLYATAYFAHAPDASSFDQVKLPAELAAFCAKQQFGVVVDIGAGSGLLARLLANFGLVCLEVDVVDREAPSYVRFDMSQDDPNGLLALTQRPELNCGQRVLLTSFDMAEHVDIEHVPNFIWNLSAIVRTDAIVSISTRPSSQANAFHATILPIETWRYLFSLVGLHADVFEPLRDARSEQQFRSDSRELTAVSYWQRRNPFHDEPSHQHYLHLVRRDIVSVPRSDVIDRMRRVLDIEYRFAKRKLVETSTRPRLFYLVSFAQDWPFLRSLMDVWQAERVFVILRRDCIAPQYCDVIAAQLRRVGVSYSVVQTIEEGAIFLQQHAGRTGDMFVTATEGARTLIHGIASLLAAEARSRGMTTVTLQHGYLPPSGATYASQFVGADHIGAFDLVEHSTGEPATFEVRPIGSLKRLDSVAVAIDEDAIAFRLRSQAKHYRQRVLVGLNLHWKAHGARASVAVDWVLAAARLNPDVFFIVRPHPDDATTLALEPSEVPNNMFLLEEMTLLCLDWPLARVIAACDAVVSTSSTLVFDALEAGKPTALLTTDVSDERQLQVETEWRRRGLITMSENEVAEGLIPPALFAELSNPAPPKPEIPENALQQLLAVMETCDAPPKAARAKELIESAVSHSVRNLSFDAHPNENRQNVDQALRKFVQKP